jgi:hypothetical protein
MTPEEVQRSKLGKEQAAVAHALVRVEVAARAWLNGGVIGLPCASTDSRGMIDLVVAVLVDKRRSGLALIAIVEEVDAYLAVEEDPFAEVTRPLPRVEFPHVTESPARGSGGRMK